MLVKGSNPSRPSTADAEGLMREKQLRRQLPGFEPVTARFSLTPLVDTDFNLTTAQWELNPVKPKESDVSTLAS